MQQSLPLTTAQALRACERIMNLNSLTMQDMNTLKSLGFQTNLHGENFWRGKHKTFVGQVIENNGPIPYVQLFEVIDKIDERPLSHRKGRHYQSLIKDCCSDGSVERALKKYDTPKPVTA